MQINQRNTRLGQVFFKETKVLMDKMKNIKKRCAKTDEAIRAAAEAAVLAEAEKSAQTHKERTFIMIKPDGVQRGLVGTIIGRFE